MPEIILASASPRRRELLAQIGLAGFRIVPSTLDEAGIVGESPAETAMLLALAKAREVAALAPSAVVIGADTLVILDGQLLGKPVDQAEARAMLGKLSGREHSVVTGLALVWGMRNRELTDYAATRVHFRPLAAAEIEHYLATGEPFDKAGAYGIQGRAAVFVDRIEGCYSNVVGLPLAKLTQALQDFGIDVWQERSVLPER